MEKTDTDDSAIAAALQEEEFTPNPNRSRRPTKKKQKPATAEVPAVEKEKKIEAVHYHCDYCAKDISNIRIKCNICPDFDLCIECFRVGAEIHPHKNDHDYRVMDNMHFPLFTGDWGADEELLLLEAVEIFGVQNWGDISDHVGTKTAHDCDVHYNEVYLKSPGAPLPDTSHILTTSESLKLQKMGHVIFDMTTLCTKKFNRPPPTDYAQPGDPPKPTIDENGYMCNRSEFDVEYDNDAESVVKDIQFLEEDSPEEAEMKLRVLEFYGEKLDERERRRNFILDRGLLDWKKSTTQDRKKTKEDRDLYHSLRVFLQVLTREQYDEFVRGLIAERNIRSRIELLKFYRSQGLRSFSECDVYDIQKKRRDSDLQHRKQRENSMYLFPDRNPGNRSSRYSNRDDGKDSKKNRKLGYTGTISSNGISSIDGAELLSEKEKDLSSSLKLLPKQYMIIKDSLIKENIQNGFVKKSSLKSTINLDVNKCQKICDLFEQAGWITVK